MKQKKRKPASPIKIRRTTQEERQVYEDACWALSDPEVRAVHQGRLVVPYHGRIVASGLDSLAVQEEAARETGTKLGDLPLISIVPLLQEMPPVSHSY